MQCVGPKADVSGFREQLASSAVLLHDSLNQCKAPKIVRTAEADACVSRTPSGVPADEFSRQYAILRCRYQPHANRLV